MSKTDILVKMDSEGRLHRVGADGGLEPVAVAPVAEMDEADIVAAAVTDADNPPMTPEDVARLRRVPRTKTIDGVLTVNC